MFIGLLHYTPPFGSMWWMLLTFVASWLFMHALPSSWPDFELIEHEENKVKTEFKHVKILGLGLCECVPQWGEQLEALLDNSLAASTSRFNFRFLNTNEDSQLLTNLVKLNRELLTICNLSGVQKTHATSAWLMMYSTASAPAKKTNW